MRIYIVILSMVISFSANAQEIIYEFPKSVNDKVQEHILQYGDTTKFVALLNVENDGKYSLTIMVNDFAKSFKDINDVLVSKTSRFAKINTTKMPLITGEDFVFADFGTVYYPENKSASRRVGKKRHVFIPEDWRIIFDRSGRIY